MSGLFRRLFALPSKLLCSPLISARLAPVASQSRSVRAMEVTNVTFAEQAIPIIQHIADSRFTAFDLEFSGVAGRRPGGGSGKLSLQQYYQELRAAAQIYQILQIGLTVVSEDVEKGPSSLTGQQVSRPPPDSMRYTARCYIELSHWPDLPLMPSVSKYQRKHLCASG